MRSPVLVVFVNSISALVDSKAVIADENSERKTEKQLTGTDNSAGISSSNNEARRGMMLPFQPLSLAFNHVNYYVDMPAVSPFALFTMKFSSNFYSVNLMVNVNFNET